MEDVRAQISTITQHISMICLGITAVMILLSFYIIWQGALTENKRRSMEASLRESEIKYRLLAETAREIIITFDSTTASPMPTRHGSKSAIAIIAALWAAPFSIFWVPGNESAFKEKVRQAEQGETTDYLLETAFRMDDDGSIVPIEATLAMMPGPHGDNSYLMAARDVTEKKKAAEQAVMQREQLYQSAKMASLGTLVSGVAHEINNPISTVMLNVQVFDNFGKAPTPFCRNFIKRTAASPSVDWVMTLFPSGCPN